MQEAPCRAPIRVAERSGASEAPCKRGHAGPQSELRSGAELRRPHAGGGTQVPIRECLLGNAGPPAARGAA